MTTVQVVMKDGKASGLAPEQLEAVARELCRLRGHPPDELVAHGAETDEENRPLDECVSERWRLAAHEITAYWQIQMALGTLNV